MVIAGNDTTNGNIMGLRPPKDSTVSTVPEEDEINVDKEYEDDLMMEKSCTDHQSHIVHFYLFLSVQMVWYRKFLCRAFFMDILMCSTHQGAYVHASFCGWAAKKAKIRRTKAGIKPMSLGDKNSGIYNLVGRGVSG